MCKSTELRRTWCDHSCAVWLACQLCVLCVCALGGWDLALKKEMDLELSSEDLVTQAYISAVPCGLGVCLPHSPSGH